LRGGCYARGHKSEIERVCAVPIDKEVSRRWRRCIRDVLNTVWDPIGGCPEDEYDAQVGKLAAMLREGASDEELIAYMCWAGTAGMGLSAQPDVEVRLLRTVEQLRAVGFMNWL